MSQGLIYPDDDRRWEPGAETFAAMAVQSSPDLRHADIHPLANRLFGDPRRSTEDGGPVWNPAPHQSPRSILHTEAVVVALLVKSWADRVDWALSQDWKPDPETVRQYRTAVLVARSALRYLDPVEGGSK